MTSLVLHYHPLSSYCHKVLIALDALGIEEVDKRLLNLGDPEERKAFIALWPTGKMPLLVDEGKAVPETSIIIEYLQRHHAAADRAPLIPAEPDAALDVRLWDRVFDAYVMTPMEVHTYDLLKLEGARDPRSVAAARERLLSSYAMLDRHLEGRTWISGEAFSMGDCAAAPSLFYAVAYVPLPAEHVHLAAYFERLMAHPSVARTVDQARPFFQYFPGKAGLQQRFLSVKPDA